MRRWLALLFLLMVPGIVLAVWLIFFHTNSTRIQTSKSFSYNSISDSSIGLSFNVSKRFEAIPKQELINISPTLNYGFRPSDDPNSKCVIALVKLTQGGALPSPEQVRDGELNEIKKIHPDAALANQANSLKIAKFGEAEGLLLEITYTEGPTKIKRVEVIAIGRANQVTAYCQSLLIDSAKYYNDFSTFFSSLKLNK